MPQLPKESDGWIDARKLALPHQILDASEVESFLEYLFREVARREQPVLLRQCAEVARYMESLAVTGLPLAVLKRGPKAAAAHDRWSESQEDRCARRCVGEMADVIWGFLRQDGQFKTSKREAALRFLLRHSETYLANPYLKRTLAFIKTHDLPPNVAFLPRNTGLRSAHMSCGATSSQDDDLSDRVFAAYYALPLAGINKRSPRIATALTASKSGAGVRKVWSWADVNERVKGYTRSRRRRLRKKGLSERDVESQFERHKAQRVDFWIFCLRFAREVKEGTSAAALRPER
jgi:hypothetical protein